MSYDDFCGCDFDEFDSICKYYQKEYEQIQQEEWERMRLLATITIQPHVKKKITPRALMSFPWDNRRTESREKILTKEERRKRFEEVRDRIDKADK